MSELIQKYDNGATIRWKLMASVSALTLLGSLAGAAADDAKPILWIEAGGQLEQLSNKQEPYAPPFVSMILNNPFTPPAKLEAPPDFSIGEEARISFTPGDSAWTFSAAIRYGRATRNGYSHEETAPPSPKFVVSRPISNYYHAKYAPAQAERFLTTDSHTHETETVLDFQAGKDVGLGMFGPNGNSTLSIGVRFAQFTSRTATRLDSDPDFAVSYKYRTFGPNHLKFPLQHWDLYVGKLTASRSFRGIGPSLQWGGDTTLAGNTEKGAITLDWGVNGALLFGRQKMKAHHQTTAHYKSALHSAGPLPLNYQTAHDTARSRSVSVPNIGGFAGLSLRYPNAKISLGYRVDYFFNAIDAGLDSAKKEDRGFYGPFASISFGLGD